VNNGIAAAKRVASTMGSKRSRIVLKHSRRTGALSDPQPFAGSRQDEICEYYGLRPEQNRSWRSIRKV